MIKREQSLHIHAHVHTVQFQQRATYDTSLFLRQNPLLSPALRFPGRIRSEIPPTTPSAEPPVPVQEIDNIGDDFIFGTIYTSLLLLECVYVCVRVASVP